MNESSEIFALVFYLLLLVTVSVIQRKELYQYYKDVLKALGISLILPFFSFIYAQAFSGSVTFGMLSGSLWSPGLPIAHILICLFCIYKFKPIRAFLAVFFIGETFALIYPFFIYTMIVTDTFI